MNKKSNVTDSELIAQYLSGDNRSFEILLYRHKSPLFGYIYSLVKDKDLAEDFSRYLHKSRYAYQKRLLCGARLFL